MTSAEKIAAFVYRFDSSQLPASLTQACGRALVDTYCAAIAGRNETASKLALRYATSQAATSGSYRAAYWGTGEMLPLELAVLCNGIAGHVLDYDDVTSPLRGHPSIAMLPAIVGLAEVMDANGRDLVAAYVCGFEVICKISHAMAVEHYAHGWHSTSTIGCIGAAVACAKLLQLSESQIVHAIGIAAAQASGSRANFGTHAKSFQAGHSNVCGLRAALMAQEGFDAAPDILESAFGYMELYGKGESLDPFLAKLGSDPLELITSGIDIKKYPLCYATHRALDGILELRAEMELKLENIQSIHVRASTGAFTPLIHTRPKTGLEGKFSMQYAITAALLDGQVGLASFTDDAVMRVAAQAFLHKVTTDDAESGPTLPRWTELQLRLTNGQTVMRRVDALRGSAQFPLSQTDLQTKASDCLDWGQAKGDVAALIDQALQLDQISVRQWRSSANLVFN